MSGLFDVRDGPEEARQTKESGGGVRTVVRSRYENVPWSRIIEKVVGGGNNEKNRSMEPKVRLNTERIRKKGAMEFQKAPC